MPIERRRGRFALLLVRAVFAAALGSVLAAPTVLARDVDVEIVDFRYAPARITIDVGDTITWTNLDSVGHTATATSGAFDTGTLESGESARTRFTVAGRFSFLCTPHPDMTGLVIVRAASSGRPPETDAEAVVSDAEADPAGRADVADPVVLVVGAWLGTLLMVRRLRASMP